MRCLTWLTTVSAAGATIVIPEIAHYEVRRELIRIRAVGSLRRLDFALDPHSGLRHLTRTTDAMIKAAEFWAFLREMGIPTESTDALDADAILAEQAALAGHPGDSITIATTNLAHLACDKGTGVVFLAVGVTVAHDTLHAIIWQETDSILLETEEATS